LTIERKKMSTKTIYKRIALVAVASLGFGMLSVAPSSAVTTAVMSFTGGTTGAVGTSATFTAIATQSTTPTANDTLTMTPVLTGTATTASAVNRTSAKLAVAASTLVGTTAGAPDTTTGAITYTTAGTPPATVSGSATYTFTPDVPGTYIFTFTATGSFAGTTNPTAFTYTATLTNAMFLTTGNTPAPVASTVTSGSALSAISGGFAKFAFIQGGTANLYNVTATNMTLSGAVSTSTLHTNLNGTTVFGGVQWAPTAVTNTLVITVSSATAGIGTITLIPISASGVPGTAITGTVTWGSAPAISAQYSLVKLLAGVDGTDVSSTTADTTTTTVSSVSGTQRFTIQVETNDQNNVALAGQSLVATITGPGLIGIDNGRSATTATGRSLAVPALANHQGSVSVWADGTSGAATITITAGGALLGTKTVTFVGAAKTATATQNLFVAKAATQLGATGSGTAAIASSVANSVAFKVVVKDTNGNAVVSGAATKIVSSDSTKIVIGTCVEITLAPGTFECSVSGAVAAASGASATVTFSVLSAATGLYDIVAAPLTFTVGGSIATVALAADAATYAPGTAMVMTATAKDSAGNAAFDGQNPYVAISANLTVPGIPASSAFIVRGVHSTTTATGVKTMFAPSTPGALVISGLTTNATTGTPFSVALTVAVAPSADIQAITTLVNSLIAKINALAKLVAKIDKKVRA
jgi:hypothetical protein